MAQSWQQVLGRARRKIHDEWASGTTDTGLRWSNTELVEAVSDGLRHLWSMRPEAFFVASRVGSMPSLAAAATQAASLGDPLPVLDQWAGPLSDYAAGTMLSDDIDHGDEQNAQGYLAAWVRALREA
jgi:hypothetical protein